jgi:hypothetical protein
MRYGTQARRKFYAASITGVAIAAFLSINAAESCESQTNSARPHDLINQEPCWTPENPDDISRCELDD